MEAARARYFPGLSWPQALALLEDIQICELRVRIPEDVQLFIKTSNFMAARIALTVAPLVTAPGRRQPEYIRARGGSARASSCALTREARARPKACLWARAVGCACRELPATLHIFVNIYENLNANGPRSKSGSGLSRNYSNSYSRLPFGYAFCWIKIQAFCASLLSTPLKPNRTSEEGK